MYSVFSTDIFRCVRAARSLLDSVRHRCAICASKSYGDTTHLSRKVPREADCAAGATRVKKNGSAGSHEASARRRNPRESWVSLSSKKVLMKRYISVTASRFARGSWRRIPRVSEPVLVFGRLRTTFSFVCDARFAELYACGHGKTQERVLVKQLA
jgi:hypothetical protein